MADMDLSILAGKFKQLRKMRDRLKSKEAKSELIDHCDYECENGKKTSGSIYFCFTEDRDRAMNYLENEYGYLTDIAEDEPELGLTFYQREYEAEYESKSESEEDGDLDDQKEERG